ncbi:aspartyl protease family protein [Anaerobaca lacustris]|uniref:Aspartyl protease family protein n=1 Tax=Anaerobaca lacustris TaxID=3044600 RepID=A0AAW6TY84_9BACT|nr:aspartyl protease family protein [Sedimentisphaerales bacterium M17dextr]
MGRVREMIRVDGRECWTLFDTGARNTYVIPAVASVLTTSETARPIRTALGGSVKETTRTALLEAQVEGHSISTHAMVIDEIGTDEDGRRIEILFGALAMQQWGIRPIRDEERLDLSHYPEDFVEF